MIYFNTACGREPARERGLIGGLLVRGFYQSDRPDGELGELLRTVPEGQLEVLLMRVVDGMSVEEVAAALGLAEGTVKSRLRAALAKLRSALKDYE